MSIRCTHYFLNSNFGMKNKSSTTKVLKRDSPNKSYLGEVFGRLMVINDSEYRTLLSGEKKRVMSCKCECGVIKKVDLAALKRGNTKSCGCYNIEYVTNRNTTHGMKGTRFYSIYSDIVKRCENINAAHYKNYGGRGIKNEFLSFEHFRDTMLGSYSDDLTIERIDVNGNYSPSNCEWIPMKNQAWNKRNNIMYGGVSLPKYCSEHGLDYRMISGRISYGWDIERAVNTPFVDIRKRIEFKGSIYSLIELCKKQGITPEAVYYRKAKGITGDDLYKPRI